MVDINVVNAFHAMKKLGISREIVEPVLINLLKLYKNNWNFIEDDNYGTLVDAIFEAAEEKAKEEKKQNNLELDSRGVRSKRLFSDMQGDETSSDKKMVQISSDLVLRDPNSSVQPNQARNRARIDLEASQVGSYQRNQARDRVPSRSLVLQQSPIDKKKNPHKVKDITKGTEKWKISLVDDSGKEKLPEFVYMRNNTIYQDAHLRLSLASIADEDCCAKCSGDCLSLNDDPQQHYTYCHQNCPLGRGNDGNMHEPCFLDKTGQRVGLRALQDLPKGAFVCEYVGEILTNIELYERNTQHGDNVRHRYPVLLDADWRLERVLEDKDALCLDATKYGNVARFVNHRCFDANLIDIPVEIETPDHHYYHVAFFTKRKVAALEELTWDYKIDFDDHEHPIKAFRCSCGSEYCRDPQYRSKFKSR